jgi:hypothetical protein
MSEVYKIEIKKVVSGLRLELSDNGHTKAYKRDFIVWSIKHGIDAISIENIEIKRGSDDIFQIAPHRNGDEWSAEIKHDAIDYSQYEYSIYWKHTNGKVYKHDPIISINPSIYPLIKPSLVIGLATLFLGLLGISLLRWRQKN